MEGSPRFAEFFAGIGLVRLALEPLGWSCAFANDIDERKAAVYRANFPGKELMVEDVGKVKTDDLPQDLTLVTGCFPCIDLSLAGNRAGLAGEHSGTFWGFHDVLKGLKDEGRPAPLLLIENVDAFLTSHGGRDLNAAVKALNALGYTCDVVIADARHFVPQSRRRLFILGEHDSSSFGALRPLDDADLQPTELRPSRLTSFMSTHRELGWGRVDFPELPVSKKRLADVVERLSSGSEMWWSRQQVREHVAAMQEPSRERLNALKRTKRGGYGTIYRRTRLGRWRAELRTDGIAGCLRTTRGGSGKQFLLVARDGKVRIRNMTPVEYARLQGVPDSVEFEHDPSPNQALYALGDAICVPLVQWIAKHAFKHALAEVSHA